LIKQYILPFVRANSLSRQSIYLFVFHLVTLYMSRRKDTTLHRFRTAAGVTVGWCRRRDVALHPLSSPLVRRCAIKSHNDAESIERMRRIRSVYPLPAALIFFDPDEHRNQSRSWRWRAIAHLATVLDTTARMYQHLRTHRPLQLGFLGFDVNIDKAISRRLLLYGRFNFLQTFARINDRRNERAQNLRMK